MEIRPAKPPHLVQVRGLNNAMAIIGINAAYLKKYRPRIKML